MKVVVALFRYIMIPLAVVFAYLSGLLMAAVSGLIEYHVLQQWLHIDGHGLTFLPAAIVIGLEGYKLFMHFSKAALKQNELFSDERLESFRRLMPTVKLGLVAFSFVCTVIFTANVFYYKVPDGRSEEQTAARESVLSEYQKQFNQAAAEIERTYNEALAAAHEPVNAAQEYFDSIEIKLTPWYEYERSKKEKDDAHAALKEAQANYQSAQKEAETARAAALKTLHKEMDPQRDEKLTALENSFLSLDSVAGDNAYLRSFLLLFSETFGRHEYSRATYFWWVIGISLALALLSEGVIAASQYVVNLPVSTLQAITGDYKISDEEKRKMSQVVTAFASVGAAMAVFLIYGMILEVTYNRVQLGAAATCSLLAVLIPSTVTALGHAVDESTAGRLAKNLIGDLRALIVKTLLSFSLFVLIGIFFGESFSTLSVPAIGVSVGNAVGHLLHLLPANPQPERV